MSNTASGFDRWKKMSDETKVHFVPVGVKVSDEGFTEVRNKIRHSKTHNKVPSPQSTKNRVHHTTNRIPITNPIKRTRKSVTPSPNATWRSVSSKEAKEMNRRKGGKTRRRHYRR